MNSSVFLNKENINTLWDLISDLNIFKFLSKNIQNKIYTIFTNNIQNFFETEKSKTLNLIDINKKYMLLILKYITENYHQQIPNKIKIYEEKQDTELNELNELITCGEIKTDRQTQFEKEFIKHKDNFTQLITVPIPETPIFLDKYKDIPINEMEEKLKEITIKRNYDEQLNNTNFLNLNSSVVNNWLKPEETSIKTEKFIQPKSNSKLENKKNVTWNSNTEYLENNESIHLDIYQDMNENINENINEDMNEDINIFTKLKKINTSSNITLLENEPKNEDKNEDKNKKCSIEHIQKIELELISLNTKIDNILNILKEIK